MTSKEIQGVFAADKSKQYEYFIKKVADFEEVWSLKDDEGWATLGLEDREYFPVWPTREMAQLCAEEEWASYYPESIELEEFLTEWLSGLQEDNIRVTVMWHSGEGIDPDWERLKADIENELEKY
ncbi:MAG: DUF2750 domain-containing protein [Ruminococcaceae bacterium]|nr:DUF2750 domain-containing protein [Oscillospiraceae bacterium]